MSFDEDPRDDQPIDRDEWERYERFQRLHGPIASAKCRICDGQGRYFKGVIIDGIECGYCEGTGQVPIDSPWRERTLLEKDENDDDS